MSVGRGLGVVELARMMIESDLRTAAVRIPRRQPVLGTCSDNNPICLSPFKTTLITGSSGAGKSTVVAALLEQMHDLAFQFCVVDPEGDYTKLEGAIVLGVKPKTDDDARFFETEWQAQNVRR